MRSRTTCSHFRISESRTYKENIIFVATGEILVDPRRFYMKVVLVVIEVLRFI